MIVSPWRNRYLIKKTIQREVVGRYRGSFLGVFWSFFTPLLMLSVYTFVFSVVFKARWGGGGESKTEFALILFAGLTVYQLFAECINRAPGLVVGNSDYVKRVIFPLEILPISNMGSALFHGSVSMAVWLLAYVVLFGTPHLTILLLPVVVMPLIFFTLGFSWMLASLGVYLRDVSQVTGIVTTALLFLSPIFYSASRLPPTYRIFLNLNPLTSIIEQSRGVMLWGQLPSITTLIIQYVFSLLVCWLGFAWFQKTRKGFADVL
ncbi:lipopolysaccharide transport system permease protein [Desulforhopalus singaporensis]|uniref:Transport permease protein n=2 Tax=Desulforhopalus singaporensis TaxID=91360 RepID=A0A1H0TX87_9BACT|nr:ABC transporter permease [Desulforhopalus singaporensis]SDP58533.1 lipopolysaccharide transport system permease protein [Desulforhopalus singaporensis]